MENKKDIGKAISDKLGSLDKSPKEQVWSGIHAELQKKKKKRGGFFFFWGTTLALLIAGTVAAFYIYNQYNETEEVIPANPKQTITVNGSNGETITVTISSKKSNDIALNDTAVTGAESPGSNTGNTTIDKENKANKNKLNQKDSKSIGNSANAENRNNIKSKISAGKSNSGSISSKSGKNASTVASKTSLKKSKGKIAKKSKGKSPKGKTGNEEKEQQELLLAETNTIKKDPASADLSSLQGKKSAETDAEAKAKKKDSLIAQKQNDKKLDTTPKDSTKTDSAKTRRKFYVDAFASPTLYGTFSNGSILDKTLDSLPKNSEMKFSYGIGLTYDLTERLSVRIGVRKINISYITKNAYFSMGPEGNANNYSGIDYYPNVSNQTIIMASAGEQQMEWPKLDITQKLSYIEIPFEIKYKFIARKLAIKSSFGFSYLMLSENKISIVTLNGFSQEIGKTRNLSNSSFSANLGMEFEYPLFKNTSLFMEPMFNYQLKASSGGNYKPYIFGINTGIRYSF